MSLRRAKRRRTLTSRKVAVVGGGLAGSEAAWQAARLGSEVVLYEMRPDKMTPAHEGGDLAELVCSNSLGSSSSDHPSGRLKDELRKIDSLIIACAEGTSVPAGRSLAVDRHLFSRKVASMIEANRSIRLVRREIDDIGELEMPAVIATGPLTSDAMLRSLIRLCGSDALYMYDAVAPIVSSDSIDFSKVFYASRYGKGTPDYINCPMDERQYGIFYEALVSAQRAPLSKSDDMKLYEACMPIEEMADRGRDTIRFGPLKPVGLRDPRTGEVPYAVVQLRREDLPGTSYNLVGFQTRLKWPEQKRVFSLIPGLENAEFIRYGVVHRNIYLDSPRILDKSLMFRNMPGLFAAGQITGSEGYTESAATGALAGMNASRMAMGLEPLTLPEGTMIGALAAYIANGKGDSFDPMGICFGLLPEGGRTGLPKKERRSLQIKEAKLTFETYIEKAGIGR
ncbi:MAG TPA: methylenetetrahydrofolate--tRNA-(uracil(54)-C(5))-methyltransferase (FADH(2)-oxidizing) TrmFO [Bacillota bacterium]|nr:methylenetetrahydrofolate--tRNA-(uracil(54)-C(5))-methyltransferase (FADH(2)-oxidizing) TrmFO [Bacillota bacterium]